MFIILVFLYQFLYPSFIPPCPASTLFVSLLCSVYQKRWLNGSAPDGKSVVLGSNPAPPQHTANSVSPEVGSHLGWHSTVCWPLRGGRGTQYTQKPLKMWRNICLCNLQHHVFLPVFQVVLACFSQFSFFYLYRTFAHFNPPSLILALL